MHNEGIKPRASVRLSVCVSSCLTTRQYSSHIKVLHRVPRQAQLCGRGAEQAVSVCRKVT